MAELADLLESFADGDTPGPGDELTVVSPPDDRSVGVLAFTGHNVVSADLGADWVRGRLPDGDVDAPLQPFFTTSLAVATGRVTGSLDVVLAARATGRSGGPELAEMTEFLEPVHSRLALALAHRADVRAWRCPGGLLIIGRGVAGRWEVSLEVEPALRGFGLGRGLFTAARALLPAGTLLWAQIAPGNAASLRAALAAGFRPVGSEQLLWPTPATGGEYPWFVDEQVDDRSDEVPIVTGIADAESVESLTIVEQQPARSVLDEPVTADETSD